MGLKTTRVTSSIRSCGSLAVKGFLSVNYRAVLAGELLLRVYRTIRNVAVRRKKAPSLEPVLCGLEKSRLGNTGVELLGSYNRRAILSPMSTRAKS